MFSTTGRPCGPHGDGLGHAFHAAHPGSALAQGAASPAQHALMVNESLRRSAAYGLKPSDRPGFDRIGKGDLSLLQERNRVLSGHALAWMETLKVQIGDVPSVVVLTDAEGTIMHALGAGDFADKARRVALMPGVNWSEQLRGTNGIGLALAEGAAARVNADEHYLSINRSLACSAVPIFDEAGKLAGALNVSSDGDRYHGHILALTQLCAQSVENRMCSVAHLDCITLHFHERPELIGSVLEGLISFAPDGRFLSANRSALARLGLSTAALRAHTLESLFGLSWSALIDRYRAAVPEPLSVRLPTGATLHAQVSARLGGEAASRVRGQRRARDERYAPYPALRRLDTGDPQMAAIIAQLEKADGRNIPILITGETGTGKEVLARALHADSARSAGPFVAVNCAAIPETLIESELFGYVDGAFSGARRKGSTGKIVQANGGTLFLDEIGDMPLHLQARLLRVLQERAVTPLGSATTVGVDATLVCATHRNLREMIAQGSFREDLYYRLNGLVLRLPPLRERSDFDVVVQALLDSEGNGRSTIAAETLALLRRHRWPGNFRQLVHLLRTAVAMAGEGAEIRPEHLSPDFRDDLAGSTPPEVRVAGRADAGASLDAMALSMVEQALQESGGNISAAARALRVSRNRIYRMLR